MIVIRSYQEAHRTFQQGQIPFRLLQEISFVMLGISDSNNGTGENRTDNNRTANPVADATAITLADVSWLLTQPQANEEFMWTLGGNLHVCQTDADLADVTGIDMDFGNLHGRWPNVTELPMQWDQCQLLHEATGDPQWAVFMNCTNDSGGAVHWIPRSLWASARVPEHIQLTRQYWG